jgi:hypothetical protein
MVSFSLRGRSVRIKGTFSTYSGDVHCIFQEHISGTFQEHISGHISGTHFRNTFQEHIQERSGNIQGTSSAHSGNIQGTFSAYLEDVQCIIRKYNCAF